MIYDIKHLLYALELHSFIVLAEKVKTEIQNWFVCFNYRNLHVYTLFFVEKCKYPQHSVLILTFTAHQKEIEFCR